MNVKLGRGKMRLTDEYQGATIPVALDKEIRCGSCHRLIFKGHLGKGGIIEFKCPKCKNKETVANL